MIYHTSKKINLLSTIQTRELFEAIHQIKLVRFELYDNEITRICDELNELGVCSIIGNALFKLSVDKELDNWSSTYRHCSHDDPNAMRFVYIHPNKQVCEAAKAFDEANDDRNLGRLLGYPECCIEAYMDWQKSNDDIDPITTVTNANPYSGSVPLFNFPNPFSRYFGGGLISHFPCSLTCVHTINLAQASCKTLQQHAPDLEEKLLILENSLVLFEKDNGICLWPDYKIEGKTIHLNPIRMHGQGKLKSVFANAARIVLFPSFINIEYLNDQPRRYEAPNCFLGAFQF